MTDPPTLGAELVRELALELRAAALPMHGAHAGRELADGSRAASGDVTFAIDERAERALETFLAERAPAVAYYSEDRGLVAPEGAEEVLVVDPVDGTRPALAGLESWCVSIAAAPRGGGVRVGGGRIGCGAGVHSGPAFLGA